MQIAGHRSSRSSKISRSCQRGNRSVREESVMSCSAEQDEDDGVAAKEPKDKILKLMNGSKIGNRDEYPSTVCTYILLMKRSLLTPLPLAPLGFSVHISLTFSRTMLQCRSKALTRANSLRLFRQEIRTWVCVRVAVWRRDRGPAVSSCSSTRATSYSLLGCKMQD